MVVNMSVNMTIAGNDVDARIRELNITSALNPSKEISMLWDTVSSSTYLAPVLEP